MQDTKICPACGEEIKAIAKKCPHCLTWQSKWKIDQSNPKYQLFWLTIFFVFIALAFYFRISVSSKLSTADFEESRQLITIEKTKMNYTTKECGGYISILGTITNNSSITWENFYFEARFYNADNILIDSLSDNDYNLVVLPGSNSTFKIGGNTDKLEEEYDHFEIILKKAREANALF
ncbi:MAG TPA: hypothetical protein ENH23_01755 [candidate division Zixibacteria bacterium]|nr:hypothetical protein [candidate division Zixibacteria bacterium]